MKVVILFEPDETCVDPLDTHKRPRRHFEELQGDVFVLWRNQTEPDAAEGHDDVHVAASGVFENVSVKEARRIARKLGLL